MAVSDFTRNQILSKFDVAGGEVSTVYEGVDHALTIDRSMTNEIAKKYRVPLRVRPSKAR